MWLVLILSSLRPGACIGAFMAGLFLAVPCFVVSPPLGRGLLMCLMCMPMTAALALAFVPPMTGFGPRLAYLCSWGGTYQLSQRARHFDKASLLQLAVATAVFATAMAVVMAVSGVAFWLPVRWLAGGIMMLAFAEMATAAFPLVAAAFGVTAPAFMRSPWRAASVSEFWTKRWNIFASKKIFRPYIFAPMARQGVAFALFAAFALSGLFHVLLAFMALGSWKISLMWGAFFVVQPLLIAAERWLGERRWRPAARRAWTLGVPAITSPLFVEPMLQIAERSWGAPGSVCFATFAVLGLVIIFSSVFCMVSVAAGAGGRGGYVTQ
jgi:alginate O-acetyltransferase complex protein AlgI